MLVNRDLAAVGLDCTHRTQLVSLAGYRNKFAEETMGKGGIWEDNDVRGGGVDLCVRPFSLVKMRDK